MTFKKTLFCLLTFFFYLNLLAQTDKKITIVDSKTRQSIPYATIKSIHKNIATYTNTDGIFSLTGEYGDSIYVSCVGYLSTKISQNKISNSQINLEQQVFELNPITVKSKKYIGEKTLGIIDARKSILWCSSGYGDEFAQKIMLPDITKIYKIKSVAIAAERFDATIPMVLHIYTMGNDSLPNTDILTKQIIVKKENFNKRKKKIVIDICDENIMTNEKYIFIAFEWLPVYKNGFKTPSTGLIVTDEVAERFTYTRSFFYGKEKWLGVPTLIGFHPNQINPNNTIISLVVDVLD